MTDQQVLEHPGAAKTEQMRAIEAADGSGRDIRDILLDAYRAEKSVRKAARQLGISQATFSNWVGDLQGRLTSELTFDNWPEGKAA